MFTPGRLNALWLDRGFALEAESRFLQLLTGRREGGKEKQRKCSAAPPTIAAFRGLRQENHSKGKASLQLQSTFVSSRERSYKTIYK